MEDFSIENLDPEQLAELYNSIMEDPDTIYLAHCCYNPEASFHRLVDYSCNSYGCYCVWTTGAQNYYKPCVK